MPKMDCDTAEHFYQWLDRTVAPDEQHDVEQVIHALLDDDPTLVNTHSWPEMRAMADRHLRDHFMASRAEATMPMDYTVQYTDRAGVIREWCRVCYEPMAQAIALRCNTEDAWFRAQGFTASVCAVKGDRC